MNVFIDGDLYKVDGVDITAMSRAEQTSIISSIFCLFESFDEVVAMLVNEFASNAFHSYKEAMKSSVYNKKKVEGESIEYDTFDINKSIDFKSQTFEDGGPRIQGKNGDIICHSNATDQEVQDALKDALNMFSLYKKTVQKVEECFFNMKNAENIISHLAKEGKSLDVFEVSPE